MKITKKQFVAYILSTFILAWIAEIIGSIYSNKGNPAAFSIMLTITMFMPLASVVIVGIPLKGMGWLPKLKGKIRYIFWALWIPALFGILGGILFFVLFPGTFDSEFLTLKGIMEKAGALEQMQEKGMTIPMYLLISSAAAVTVAPFLNMFAAIGEEAGWRGALYPYLKRKLGVVKGRIAGGVIWGIWHWPAMILAGYEYGKEYALAPFSGMVVFCIFTIVVGIVLDDVYEKTKVIWIPALMHGAINAFTIFAYLMKPEYAHLSILGPSFIGIISMIPLMILACVLCLRKGEKTA